jgi:chromate transporter
MRASCRGEASAPERGGAGIPASAPPPSTARLFLAFLRLGATAFGGPATIVQMRALAVTRKQWLSAGEFDEGLALAQVLPGATAMQCAACTGLRLRGFAGALAAFVGFGLPAFLLMLAAATAYRHAVPLLAAQAVLRGLRVAVVAIVAWAALDLARAQLKSLSDLLIVLFATVLLVLGCHPALVVVAMAAAGMLRAKRGASAPVDLPAVDARQAIRQVGLLVLVAIVATGSLFALSPGLASLALAMMRIDAVAFGGGFAALPLMWSEFVTIRAALPAEAFVDGIALGQVTPGPIVITATFVGYAVAGLWGGFVATAGIFFPSFTLVVALAPWWRRLQRLARVQAATRAAALAFVGLLVSMALQLVKSVPWTVGLGLLALAALVALGLRARILGVVLACAALAPLLQKLGAL